MSKRATAGLSAPVLLLLLAFGLFVLAMRMKYAPVQDRLRRFTRDYGNPRMIEKAGQPGETLAIVRHVGRSSGTPYESPVETAETEDGFVTALPYGTRPDWLQNVLAAGSAVVVRDDAEQTVTHPELISADEGNPYFPTQTQFIHRLFGVNDFLRLYRVS